MGRDRLPLDWVAGPQSRPTHELDQVDQEVDIDDHTIGQHEMNIQYAEILEMADRHTVMKQAMKEIADGLGVSVTFMAKPSAEEAGSSCHLHVSLWEGNSNAFPGEHPLGPVRGSDVFRWFLGGWMSRAPDLMVFMAPTINSYKRYQDDSWAPTRLAWGYDNRTVGFRVVGREQSLRIECRIPGADVNPYLVYAGVLAAGMDGIANRIEPPGIFEGDAYQAEELPEGPKTLRDALDLFANSEFVRGGVRIRCPVSLLALLSDRAECLRQLRHRLGTSTLLRANMTERSAKKVALITGAGSEIGLETTLLFYSEGASVVAADINEDAAMETVEMARAAGGTAAPQEADVSSAIDCEEMVASAESLW